MRRNLGPAGSLIRLHRRRRDAYAARGRRKSLSYLENGWPREQSRLRCIALHKLAIVHTQDGNMRTDGALHLPGARARPRPSKAAQVKRIEGKSGEEAVVKLS